MVNDQSTERTPSLLMVAMVLSVAFSSAPYCDTLIVIEDTGNTFPISRYTQRHTVQSVSEPPSTANTLSSILQLPITTPSLTPGNVKTLAFTISHLQTPLFFVGNDPLSKAWIVERRLDLIKLGAVGLLVEAHTEKDIIDINTLAKGLRILPISGEDIAKQLSQPPILLRHYPVLISKQGIEQ